MMAEWGKVDMKKNRVGKSISMPMLEMVITVGLFTIISVIILHMFLAANRIQTDALEISKAVIKAERIAEGIKGQDTIEEAEILLKMQKINVNANIIYYNNEWKQVDNKDIYYAEINRELIENNFGTISKYTISFYKNMNNNTVLLYRLPISKYKTNVNV